MEIQKIVKKLSLKEKIALCSGKNFWETKALKKYNVSSIFMCDGPHGLRKQEKKADMLSINKSREATCFPAEVTTASTWNPELLEKIGNAIGEEAKDQGVNLVLGPGANIKRNPLCGRNFEYFSEDPFLSGKMAAAFIRGIENQGVASSLKHFACNSQENNRFLSDGIIDERTLRELYLRSFEIAVKEGKPSTVMCAYPKINGKHCSGNEFLLKNILRDEWKFGGLVVTDWGAMNNRIEGFKAGCDLNMPGGSSFMEKETLRAVKNGLLSEDFINESATRILSLIEKTKTNSESVDSKKCDYENHHGLAKKVAADGMVLLKNENEIMPLSKNESVAIIGSMAKKMRFQGAGSSHINPTKIINPLDCFNSEINFTFASGCNENGETSELLLNEAIEAAKKSDKVLVFAGLPEQYESEGFDRENMKMPLGHIKMIEAVAKINPNTVVVLICGSAVECPWVDCVKGILYAGLPGQAGGEAIFDLLYGKINPSGRLAETWPMNYSDVPSADFYNQTKDALYIEGIYSGYRFYDKAKIKVRWPFGFGLSYTKFDYSNIFIDKNKISITVTNVGKYFGGEVVQLFVQMPQDGIHRPVRELKDFQKIYLDPNESKKIDFEIAENYFSVWHDGKWKIPKGNYFIEIGNQTGKIEMEGESVKIPDWQSGNWYENCSGKPNQAEWEKLIGKKYVPQKTEKGNFTLENTVEEMKESSLLMKIFYNFLVFYFKRSCSKKENGDAEFKMLMNSSARSPLRNMQICAGLKGGLFAAMVEFANGHFFNGIGKIFRG